MEFITRIFTTLEDLTWGWSLIPILVIFGLFMTVVTGFVQIRYFGRMFRVLFPNPSDPGADGDGPRFLWLAGQGGHGVQTAPALSRLAADLCLGRAPRLPASVIAALSPARLG